MIDITKNYNLNVSFSEGKFESDQQIKIVENDNQSTKLIFNFTEELNERSLILKIKHYLGQVYEYPLEISNQQAEFTFPNTILVAGTLKMSISLIGDNDEILTVVEYLDNIEVIESLGNGSEATEGEVSALAGAIAQVNSLKTRILNGEFDGASAYEVAVNNGFEGTEAEWIRSLIGAEGKGIKNITKTDTQGLLDTYTVTYTDNSIITYTVRNGNGIVGITEHSRVNNDVTYRMTFTDGTHFDFSITEGSNYDDTEIIERIEDLEENKLSSNDPIVSWCNTVKENFDSDTIEKAITNIFAMTPDYGIYGVRFSLWDTSNTSAGEKYGANLNKYLNLATDTVVEETNYSKAFETYDCNAYVDNKGVRHITALKGMPGFKDTGKNDVFVLCRTYFEKEILTETHRSYERTYMPKDGYRVVSEAINKDGTYNAWFLLPKYASSFIDGVPYSTKGKAPARNNSYNNCVTNYRKKGNNYYSAASAGFYKHLETTIQLKFATKNSQNVMAGNTNNNFQYQVSTPETNVKRVILTTAQANNIDLYSCVSVGDRGTATNNDRGNAYMHNIIDDVRVIEKETIDSEHIALILDVENTFSTTETTWVSTMHEVSGYSDMILGRNGSVISNTNGKHGAVLDGIEWAVGGYEVVGNIIMDIPDNTATLRDIYITNDSTKITTNVTTAKTTYNKSQYQIAGTNTGAWNYITEKKLDLVNGIAVPTKSGQSGSGSTVGYADGVYFDAGTSGQREFLVLGNLSNGADAGVSCLPAGFALSNAYWDFLARLSINGVGGELAA